LFARIAFDGVNDANCCAKNSRKHSHSRECEYSGKNYYANVRANCSRQCGTALTLT